MRVEEVLDSEVRPRVSGKAGQARQMLFSDGKSTVTEGIVFELAYRLTKHTASEINKDKDRKNLSCIVEDEVDEVAVPTVVEA